MKSLYITDIRNKNDEEIEEIFVVIRSQIKPTRTGQKYIDLLIGDSTGEMKAVVFDDIERLSQILQPSKVIRLKARIQRFGKDRNLKVIDASVVAEDKYELADIVPMTDKNINQMYAELLKFVQKVSNKHLKNLLLAFFGDIEFAEKFKMAPGARKMHHAYVGGLLEHTLEVTRFAYAARDVISGLKKDILIAGGLLHDIGKVREYTWFPRIDRTDEGRLMGHIAIGYEMAKNKISSMKSFPNDLAMHILHIILSHHGQQEWGSPIVPMTPESMIIHFADNMSAKLWMFQHVDVSSENARWSDYHRGLSRYVFLGGEEEEEPEGGDFLF